MARVIGIGKQDFEKIRVNNNFYIDKTKFIQEWWEAADEVTLITRPRRFGKTLNMNMLEKFFSVNYKGREDLFQGLDIWENAEYRNLQGTYPVIFLSFADIKETSFPETRQKICKIIQMVYNKFDFLLEGNLLNENEKNDFRKISPYFFSAANTSPSVNPMASLWSLRCRMKMKRNCPIRCRRRFGRLRKRITSQTSLQKEFRRNIYESTVLLSVGKRC